MVMRVVGVQPQTYITIEPLSRDDFRLPTLYVRAEMSAAGLSGIKPKIALDIADLNQFLKDLSFFDVHRTGVVRLNSMSPNEFILALRIVDHAGHMLVKAVMTSYIPVNYQLTSCRVALCFEIDSTLLPNLISGVQDLLRFQTPAS